MNTTNVLIFIEAGNSEDKILLYDFSTLFSETSVVIKLICLKVYV